MYLLETNDEGVYLKLVLFFYNSQIYRKSTENCSGFFVPSLFLPLTAPPQESSLYWDTREVNIGSITYKLDDEQVALGPRRLIYKTDIVTIG